jgi:hypothetical protein
MEVTITLEPLAGPGSNGFDGSELAPFAIADVDGEDRHDCACVALPALVDRLPRQPRRLQHRPARPRATALGDNAPATSRSSMRAAPRSGFGSPAGRAGSPSTASASTPSAGRPYSRHRTSAARSTATRSRFSAARAASPSPSSQSPDSTRSSRTTKERSPRWKTRQRSWSATSRPGTSATRAPGAPPSVSSGLRRRDHRRRRTSRQGHRLPRQGTLVSD